MKSRLGVFLLLQKLFFFFWIFSSHSTFWLSCYGRGQGGIWCVCFLGKKKWCKFWTLWWFSFSFLTFFFQLVARKLLQKLKGIFKVFFFFFPSPICTHSCFSLWSSGNRMLKDIKFWCFSLKGVFLICGVLIYLFTSSICCWLCWVYLIMWIP